MKKILTLLLPAFFACYLISAQQGVGINTDGSAPHPSAMLEIKSTNKGLLIPRMTSGERDAINSPALGLLVYETTSNSIWAFNGTSWTQLGTGGSGGNSPWVVSGNNIYNSNSGNVGIGVNAPTAKLHLSGLMKIDDGQIDIDNAIGQFRILSNGSPKGYFKLNGSSGDIEIGTNVLYNDIGKLTLETKSTPRLTILPNGNVGIGTIVPSTKFDVNGTIHTSGRIEADGVVEVRGGFSAIAGAGLYVTGTSLLEGNVTANGNATVSGNINSNTSMTITDAAAILQLKSNGSTNLGFMQLSGNNLRIGTNSSNDLGSFIVRTNNADRFVVDALGVAAFNNNVVMTANAFINGNARTGTLNVGTSLNTPGYVARIGGKLICEEVKVKLISSGWPDYVFSEKYKLPTLQELRSFITKNKHLPNIPSAEEVEKNGIEVGDMQKRVMEKIEELTLYILQLEEKTQKLQAEIENLKSLRK